MFTMSDMRVACQFFLSFRNKIVGVERLPHICPEKSDGTQSGEVGPVCGLGCLIEIPLTFTKNGRTVKFSPLIAAAKHSRPLVPAS